jgi:hypothetical protein
MISKLVQKLLDVNRSQGAKMSAVIMITAAAVLQLAV